MNILKFCLNLFRWAIASLLGIVFIFFIIFGFILLSASLTVTNRESTKKLLKEGGVYDNIVNIAVDEQFKIMDRGVENGNAPTVDLEQFITRDELKERVNKTLSPMFLEKNGNLIIDSVYDWLDGKTDKPTFSIDLSDIQKETKQTVAELMMRKVSILSECKNGKIIRNQEEIREDFNLFSAECLPRDVNKDEVNKMIQDEIGKSDIFSKTRLDSTEIKFDEEMLSNVSRVYRIIRYYPLIFFSVIVLFSMLIILIVPGLSRGLITLALIWFIAGSGVGVITWFGRVILESRISVGLARVSGLPDGAKILVQRVMDLLLQGLYTKNFVFSAVSVIISAIFAGVCFYVKRVSD